MWAPEAEPNKSRPWSSVLWGLDWDAALPWALDVEAAAEIRLEHLSPEGALRFTETYYSEIFNANGTPGRTPDPMTPTKRRFVEQCDAFAFVDAGKVVGLLMGHPLDWSSYYWRSVALLPAYRGLGLVAAALSRTEPILSAVGVQRTQGETAPGNLSQIRLLHRLGYQVVGTVNCDRWGPLLRLTKLLASDDQTSTKGGDREEIRNAQPLERRCR